MKVIIEAIHQEFCTITTGDNEDVTLEQGYKIDFILVGRKSRLKGQYYLECDNNLTIAQIKDIIKNDVISSLLKAGGEE